jgi:hypothetical protein
MLLRPSLPIFRARSNTLRRFRKAEWFLWFPWPCDEKRPKHAAGRIFSDTGKALKPHYKTVRGSKKIAQVYMDWYAGLVDAGNPPRDVISQTELQDLAHLEGKAAAFRYKLLARASAGSVVQPGPLSFAVGGDGALNLSRRV